MTIWNSTGFVRVVQNLLNFQVQREGARLRARARPAQGAPNRGSRGGARRAAAVSGMCSSSGTIIPGAAGSSALRAGPVVQRVLAAVDCQSQLFDFKADGATIEDEQDLIVAALHVRIATGNPVI